MMAITVSKVQNMFSDYIRANRHGKARFKLAIADSEKVLVSKGSYAYETNITTILRDYASGKNGQEILGIKFENGVHYKINGHQYKSNYVEVVVFTSGIVACNEESKLASFINEESRVCHDHNSRDRHVNEMLAAIKASLAEGSGEPEEPVDNGEDA